MNVQGGDSMLYIIYKHIGGICCNLSNSFFRMRVL